MDFSKEQIKKAAQALSERYRLGDRPYLRSPQDRYAYLVTRSPATQAALERVLKELPSVSIESYLDVGSGPGTSWNALQNSCEGIKKATFIERDLEFIKIGRNLLSQYPIDWRHEIAADTADQQMYDLVLFSYSWGEIQDLKVLEKAWKAAYLFLIIVEPGTPLGFERVIEARRFLIERGAFVVAPCPHQKTCPWSLDSKEWCHFAVRLERSEQHRWAKEGSLGYEDEKFSYIILSKKEFQTPWARMIKDPCRRKGHTIMTLCTNEGIQTTTVSKKEKVFFKSVNKSNWGDKIIDSI